MEGRLARVVIVPQVALFSQASEYEHEHSQSFRFPSSTRYFGRIVVRDQLDWVGAARVLGAPKCLACREGGIGGGSMTTMDGFYSLERTFSFLPGECGASGE